MSNSYELFKHSLLYLAQKSCDLTTKYQPNTSLSNCLQLSDSLRFTKATVPKDLAGLRMPVFSATVFRFSILCITVIGMVMPIMGYTAPPSDLVKEQQQALQDQIQQQRIDALKQAQSTQIDNNKAATLNESVDSETVTAAESPPEGRSSCLSVHRIIIGSMEGLDKSIQWQLQQQAEQLSSDFQILNVQTQDTSTQDASNIKANISKDGNAIQDNVFQDNGVQDSVAHPSCISVDKANVLVRQITKAYLDAGYFRIAIKPEPMQNNTSVWQIHVATIQSIDNKTNLPTPRLFGDIVGKPANIAWLDQAVSNGERLIEGQLLLDIYPVGDDVRIQVSQQGNIDTLSGDLQWRYDPNDSYGHNKIIVHASLANVLEMAELTSLSIQQTLSDEYGYDQHNHSQSASLYSIIPSGRWMWSGMVAADQSKTRTLLPHSVLEQTGDSWQASLRADFTLMRDQDSITSLYGQVAHQDVSSKILGSQIDIQSPTLSSGRLGASYTKLFNKHAPTNPNKISTGAWVLDLSAEQGFGNHDNPATKAGLSDDYLRWLLSGYLSHQHSIVRSGKNVGFWQMTHELQGQYSDDNLFGVNRQSLGSTYSGVRGIDNAYNAASTGVTLRNTLSFQPLQSSWKVFGLATAGHKMSWSPYIGLDYGLIKYAYNKNSDDTSDAASGTLGVTLTGYDIKDSSLDRRWQYAMGASRAQVDYAVAQENRTLDTEIFATWQLYF